MFILVDEVSGSGVENFNMAEPRAQTMGNYFRPTNASQVSLGFLPSTPVNFNIKYSALLDLGDKSFYGNATSDPWKYLAMFHETTSMCQLEDIIEDQVKLKLSNVSLVGRAKDWLYVFQME